MTDSSDFNEGVKPSNNEDDGPLKTAFVYVYNEIRSSVLVFTIALGFVTAVLGATPLFGGYVAGLMGVSGVSLILFGLIGLGLLRLIGYSG